MLLLLKRRIFPILLFFSVSTVLMNIVWYHNIRWRNLEYDIGTAHIYAIVQERLAEAMLQERGGCDIPKLDPFANPVTHVENETTVIDCYLPEWVKCNFSECTIVVDGDVSCTLRDILYRTDNEYDFGAPTVIKGHDFYTLKKSDHVKIECNRLNEENFVETWEGVGAGYRPLTPVKPAPGREKTPNVLILGFDSVSKNKFIRKLPKSYKFITEELEAVVLNKYNVVGDGTTPALFAMLAGLSEVEHPECRRGMRGTVLVDEKRFLFHKLRKDGYRTLYYEDSPWLGTFNYRLLGFKHQPADHYLRPALQEEMKIRNKSYYTHCFGGTPVYKVLIDLTDQFLKLEGKHFAFTFVVHVAHEPFNALPYVDELLVQFLNGLKQNGRLNDTLLMIMSDHGSRFTSIRKTYQGKMEERLPFMAIRLPDELKTRRPEAAVNLKHNVDTLTTPFDIHTTVLDVVDMREHWNNFKIKFSNLPRGMTLLEKIPKNRSCSEAGILPHWCSCLKWEAVAPDNPIYNRSALALVDHINDITQFQRNKCAVRNLTSIDMVVKKTPSKLMLLLEQANSEFEVFLGRFGNVTTTTYEQLYQVKITAGPGNGTFEATITYHRMLDKFYISSNEISRTNAYNNEPACVSATYPHLSKYCYCI